MEKQPNAMPQNDGFVPETDSRFGSAHSQIASFLMDPKGSLLPAQSSKFEKTEQLSLLCAAMEQVQYQRSHGRGRVNLALTELVKKLAGRKLPYSEADLVWILNRAALILTPKDPKLWHLDLECPIPGVIPALLDELELCARQKPLSEDIREPLAQLQAVLKPMEFQGGYKKSLQRVETMLEGKAAGVPDDGEPWAAAIRKDVAAMPSTVRKHWLALLENAPKGTTAKPTVKWKEKADKLLAAVGPEVFAQQVEQWFRLVGMNTTERIKDRNATMLRALIWYCGLVKGEAVCRALANVIEGGLRKLPRGSLYASSISKAGITALEAMPGLEPAAQLSRLKYRIKSPWGLEEVEKALASAVERSGLSRVDVEEISVPAFGLDENGGLTRQVGNYTCRLQILDTQTVELKWSDAAGKEVAGKLKLSPDHESEAKSLKPLANDIRKMLGAHRDRVENFLERDRSWPYEAWQERYLNHPLMSQIARRLIWQFQEGKKSGSAIWRDDRFIDSNNQAVGWLTGKSEVRLWHPLGCEISLVQAWRRWLEENGITQPFKQAHREIYVITDAELGTGTYSNRFAAHILRQHQLKALCDQRGWRYEFLGEWDQTASGASKDLPGWNLRAEFWTEHCGDEYAASGVGLHVSTDQVRFSKPDEEEISLTEVPAMVFSEVMRDVDLFVSVSSVGNDPNWADGGTDRSRDYWYEFSFGNLGASAKTRKDVLERLLPRLKIAAQCSFDDKFLIVRGSLRTYKIHLGSGNIQMDPNNQYLCIVPDRSPVTKGDSKLFLPFEGDSTLAVILSKAFLLAEDSKIKDPTIVRQITRTEN